MPWDRCKIVQKGLVPRIAVDPTRIPKTGGELPWNAKSSGSVHVEANVEWSYTVDQPSWIKVTRVTRADGSETGLYNGDIYFTVEKNLTGGNQPRIGHISVWGGGAPSKTVTIVQEKQTKLNLSGKTVPYKADTHSLRVEANVDWKLSVLRIDPFPDGNWLVIPKKWKQGNGNAVVEFHVTENNTGRKRTVDVRLTGGRTSKTVTITQLPKPILKVVSPSPKEPVKVSYKKRVNPGYKVSVKSNIKWKATVKTKEADGNWLTLNSEKALSFTGKNSGTFEFCVAENKTQKPRTGKIVLTGKDVKPVTIVIVQKKAPLLKISPASTTLSHGFASSWFYVTANVKWTAKSSASWLRVTNVLVDKTGAKNGGYVEYDVDDNTTAKNRTATITVTGGNKSVVFTLTQKAKPLPNLCFYRPSGWPKAVFVANMGSQYYMKENTTLTRYRDEWARGFINFAWKNTGDTDIGKYTIKVDYGNEYPDTVTRSGLMKGESEKDCVNLYWNKTGNYTVTFMLDPDNAIKESDETDNTATVSFSVVYADESAYGGRVALSYATLPPDKNVEVEPEPPIVEQNPEEPVDNEVSDKAGWVAVVASGGEDAGAVADGDEETAWTPDATEESWVVLTFPEPVDATDAELVGDNLPDGTRLFFSEDSETWHEELPASVQYVWAVFPACEDPFAVREIRLISE